LLAILGFLICFSCGRGGGGVGESPAVDPHTDPLNGPPAGNPAGHYTVPAEAVAEDVSSPDRLVGNGTPGSCTSAAFIQAVAQGGKIKFNCRPDPYTITLDRPVKVFNDKPDVVIDGGGLITLSGGGATRILYMNTCDPDQVWTTDHCQDQAQPRLTVQNLTFIDANSRNESEYDGGYGNIGANGGGISSIGVSWAIYNSLFSHNRAIGNGGNPAQSGTPGGGSGGAIYNDGNTMTLALYGTLIENNQVNTHGSAIFFITNDHTGTLRIEDSVIRQNSGGYWYELPGISMHSDTNRQIVNSTIE